MLPDSCVTHDREPAVNWEKVECREQGERKFCPDSFNSQPFVYMIQLWGTDMSSDVAHWRIHIFVQAWYHISSSHRICVSWLITGSDSASAVHNFTTGSASTRSILIQYLAGAWRGSNFSNSELNQDSEAYHMDRAPYIGWQAHPNWVFGDVQGCYKVFQDRPQTQGTPLHRWPIKYMWKKCTYHHFVIARTSMTVWRVL